MKKVLVLLLFVSSALAFGLAGKAQAAPFQLGDIFAGVASGQVQHYDAAGTLLETLNTGQGGLTTGMAFDAASNLYVTNWSASTVSKFTGPGDPHTPSLFVSSGLNTPESIVFDAAGDVYIGNVFGGGIRKYDAAGTFQNAVISTTRIDWMDLAADQTTMLFTQEGAFIKSVDVTTGVLNPNFASGLTQAFALRILADGGVLVADLGNVKRFNAAGTLIQTYDVGAENTWFSLNLNPDGTSFWAGNFGSGIAYEFDVASGALTQTLNTGVPSSNFFGLTIFGETTAGGPPMEAVPEPSSLLLLGSGLAGLAGWRWRQARLNNTS